MADEAGSWERRRFLFVLASTREGGNSEALARHAARSLPDAAARTWVRLRDLPMERFRDVRHDGAGEFPRPEGALADLWRATREATDVVVVSPLYWYSLSSEAKLYLDHWSGWFRVPGATFRADMEGSTLWGVTAYHSPTPEHADPLVGALRNTADFMRMRWGGVLLGKAVRPGDLGSDPTAAAEAATFFTRPLHTPPATAALPAVRL
ncbi:flavodoxin family protein [Streptomyces sp. NPDC050560]|uniref:flavodoxin family protein n=1 Tax=Streptomyces sp. NPDC050560 TaxID=3365630 RepID=UPI0037878E29